MKKLHEHECEACRRDAPTATSNEISEFKILIPEWEVIEDSGIKKLVRRYQFNNFVNALAFTNKIGEIAEQAGHHPDLLTEWGKVTVTWWSHKIKGLHRNDFIMAAKSDYSYDTGS